MKLEEILRNDCVIFNLKSEKRDEVLNEMCEQLEKIGAISDSKEFLGDILKRESIAHTALDEEVATPHAKSKAVIKPTVMLGINKKGVDFSNGETPLSKLVFMIAVPDSEFNLHIDILTKISKVLLDEEKIHKLINSTTYDEIKYIIKEKEDKNFENVSKDRPYIVAVTACPTGIAHTFMARDALNKAASELNVEIKIETNGTDGRKNEITKNDLERAKGVILAINKSVDEERFNGYKVIKVGAKQGISNAKQLIQDVLDGKGEKANFKSISNSEEVKGDGIYKHLLNGVSYMLPLVVSGGILIALAFLFDSLLGFSNAKGNFGSSALISSTFMTIGKSAFELMIPILAGYISFSIGKKSALASGLVAGVLANSSGSGFLGAIFGGIIAGYIVLYLDKFSNKVIQEFKGIYLILFVPVVSVFITGLLMMGILNPVVGWIMSYVNSFLLNLGATPELSVILGLILGAMMAVDMGGPINKVAYVFGTGTLSIVTNSSPMAAVMAGGMVPPLAIAISTTLFKNKYTIEDRQAGITNYILGLSFITEGAIPFAAKDPLRVIPACMVGSAIAGALTMLFNVTIAAPHGGILVMLLSNKFIIYLECVLFGSLVSGILLGLLKRKEL